MYKKVYLKKGKEDSLLRFHPWIFSGAIKTMEEEIKEGEVVCVLNNQGKFIAIGHYQVGSIAIRVLSFEEVYIDESFYENRLFSAFEARKAIGVINKTTPKSISKNNNTTFRLVHGEGDNLPGLIIDIYGNTAVMQAHSVGMHVDRHLITNALINIMGDNLNSVYYKSETTLPYKANLGQEDGFIYGYTDNNIATENGLLFHIDWIKGQKTGFFIDQRENRKLLEFYSKDRSVLNMFCYTGGFSV